MVSQPSASVMRNHPMVCYNVWCGSIYPGYASTPSDERSAGARTQTGLSACEDAASLLVIKGDAIPVDRYSVLLTSVKCPKVYWMMDSLRGIKDGLARHVWLT